MINSGTLKQKRHNFGTIFETLLLILRRLTFPQPSKLPFGIANEERAHKFWDLESQRAQIKRELVPFSTLSLNSGANNSPVSSLSPQKTDKLLANSGGEHRFCNLGPQTARKSMFHRALGDGKNGLGIIDQTLSLIHI